MVNVEDEAILERLLSRGAGALCGVELVATLLQPSSEASALDQARLLLDSGGGMLSLLTVTGEVAQAQGLDRLQSARLLAAVELGRRLTQFELGFLLEDPEIVARYVSLKYGRINQVVAGAIFSDVQNHMLGDIEAFRGRHDVATVDLGPILREVIRHNSRGILFFVYHPSGDVTPTQQDVAFARRLVEACEWLGLELLDFLICAGERWTSIRRLRLL